MLQSLPPQQHNEQRHLPPSPPPPSPPQQQQQEPTYNPRPTPRPPDPRVEVEEVRGLTGARSRVRVVLGTEGASSVSSVFTLCNSAVGAGVLSLPYAFQCAGLVGCLVLSLVVATLEAFTMYVLAKFAERYDASSYGQLIRRALGRKTAVGLSGVLLIYLWGSCVAYLIIIADTFTSLAAQHLGPDALLAQRTPVLLGASLVVLVMCFPRDLRALERVSFLAVLGFLYTAGAVLVRGSQAAAANPKLRDDISLFKADVTALYAVPIVVFGFNCHANVVAVFYELEHYPHRIIWRLPSSPAHYLSLGPLAPKPSTYRLIGMLGAIISAAATIFTGYMSVGVAGYLAYPFNVSSNILNSFPASDVTMQVARGVIGAVVLGHWPLNHNPARKAWEDLLDAAADVKSVPPVASACLTVAFVAVSLGISLVVTDLGSVLHMIGGTAASFMIFFLPGMLLMNAAIIKHTASTLSLSQLAEDAEDGSSGGGGGGGAYQQQRRPDSTAGDDAASDDLGAPLLMHKKAGFRNAGFIFVGRKSWVVGLVLVCISWLVLGVTVLTAVLG